MKSQELLKLNKQGRKELYLEKRVIMLMIMVIRYILRQMFRVLLREIEDFKLMSLEGFCPKD